jgi:hypothetical protein
MHSKGYSPSMHLLRSLGQIAIFLLVGEAVALICLFATWTHH